MKKVLAIFLVLCTLCISASALSLSSGSSGETVRQLQQALKDKGYDPGEIDGIFGSRTKQAVLAFQKDNGLAADGIAGPKTLSALGIQASNTNSSSDIYLLARAVYGEAPWGSLSW